MTDSKRVKEGKNTRGNEPQLRDQKSLDFHRSRIDLRIRWRLHKKREIEGKVKDEVRNETDFVRVSQFSRLTRDRLILNHIVPSSTRTHSSKRIISLVHLSR